MKMNILLVYPKFPESFWTVDGVLKYISKKSVMPPLGLLTIASMLPNEWNKKLVDTNVTTLTNKHIEWADLVFISAMIVQIPNAKELIKKCKAHGKRVVGGGPAFTTLYDQFEEVDHFVQNEGEVTLNMFVKDLNEGNPKRFYSSPIKPDVTKTPIPMWSLINFKDYMNMVLQYSRGCPFNCEFCDIIIMNGRVPRTKTPEQFVAEFQSLYDNGWRGVIFIVDDNFIGNKMNVKRMLPSLITWQKEHNYPFRLYTEASVNLADDIELLQLMKEANFYKIFLGIETPNVESLKETAKFQNLSRNLVESVRAIQQHGFEVMGGFIVGFDNDTEEIFETQIKFIQETGVLKATVSLLNALPETRLWHRLKAEGRLLEVASGDFSRGDLNFMPKMGKEKLMNGYKKLISKIYSPEYYYERLNTFLKTYNHDIKKIMVRKDYFMAFIKSIWYIGILSRDRLFYWKLIIKTSLTKLSALPIVIEAAIFRQHLESLTNKICNQGDYTSTALVS